jgi:hypothetical protein
MTTKLRAAAIGLGLALTLAAGQARAAEPPAASSTESAATREVLLLPVEAEGLPPADRQALDDRLRPIFEHPDIELIEPQKNRREPLESCPDEACLRKLAREHGASHVVRATVVADGRDFVATLEVLTLDRDEPASTIDASCQICGLAEFDELLEARAVAARDQILATPQFGRLEIVGQPLGARVHVDGKWRGQLPFSESLSIGHHELIVVADGHFRKVVPIETLAGVEQRLTVELAPKPIPRWSRTVGWTSLGIGLGALTTGAAFIAVHGQPAALRCKSGELGLVDDEGDCRWLRQTLGAGVGLTVAGIAAATAGITLLSIDGSRRRARARAAAGDVEIRALVGINRIGLRIRF